MIYEPVGRMFRHGCPAETWGRIMGENMQAPSIGRIVLVKLYRGTGVGEVCPAIINRVHAPGMIDAFAFPCQSSPLWMQSLTLDEREDGLGGTWRWPPRVG